MKVLFVAPWVPGPVRSRSVGMLRLLRRYADVRVLALSDGMDEGQLGVDMGQSMELVRNRSSRALLRAAGAYAAGRSLQTAYADAPQFRHAFSRVMLEWRPDVVHLNVFRTAHLAVCAAATPVVIDLDEFRSEYYTQLSRSAGTLRRVIARHESRSMKLAEDELVRSNAHILVSGEAEGARVQRGHIHVVRTPVWSSVRRGVYGPAEPPILLFAGRLSYEANVDAICWFARTIWPLVHEVHPAARLRIVGSEPRRAVRALADLAGVEIHANVASLDPHYAAATIAICPLERATGVQLKLIQALAASVPTVVSPLVAELAGTADGKEVLVASTPRAWLEATLRLLGNRELQQQLAAGGMAWYERNHSPDVVARQLEVAYRSVCDAGGPTVSASPPRKVEA